MYVKGVEEEQTTIELECVTCGYIRTITLPRNKLLIRKSCPQCKKTALQKKHQTMTGTSG